MARQTKDGIRALARLAVVAAIAGYSLPALAQAPSSKAVAAAPMTDPATEKARAEHDLAQAAFARPDARPAPTAAAKVASESADAKAAAPVEPKPEWVSKEAVHRGGKGLQISSPF